MLDVNFVLVPESEGESLSLSATSQAGTLRFGRPHQDQFQSRMYREISGNLYAVSTKQRLIRLD